MGKDCNMQDRGDRKKEFGFDSKSSGEISRKGTNRDQLRILRHGGGCYREEQEWQWAEQVGS